MEMSMYYVLLGLIMFWYPVVVVLAHQNLVAYNLVEVHWQDPGVVLQQAAGLQVNKLCFLHAFLALSAK
jgi:hypothetical protein